MVCTRLVLAATQASQAGQDSEERATIHSAMAMGLLLLRLISGHDVIFCDVSCTMSVAAFSVV